MEAEASLVWTYCRIELDTVTRVGLHLSTVIYPGHSEREDTVRFYHPLDYLCTLELGVLIVNFLDGLEYFLNSLQILTFTRILGRQPCKDR